MELSEFKDKYKMLCMIGSGGFGEVWLAKMRDGAYCAVKSVSKSGGATRELEALKKYVKFCGKAASENIIKIGDVCDGGDCLYYAMPLADGLDSSISPEDERWVPDTLQARIDARKSADEWFSRAEILAFISPVISAAQAISAAGLLHRDIKPQNILFVGGKIVLADIGLASEDRLSASSAGTPKLYCSCSVGRKLHTAISSSPFDAIRLNTMTLFLLSSFEIQLKPLQS